MKKLINKMYQLADIIDLDLVICLDDEKCENGKVVFRTFLSEDYFCKGEYQREYFSTMKIDKEPSDSLVKPEPVIRVTTCKNVKKLMDEEKELVPYRRSNEIIEEKGLNYKLRERMRICSSGKLCDYTEEEIKEKVIETIVKGILVQITLIIESTPFKHIYDKQVTAIELPDNKGNILLPAHELVEFVETDNSYLPRGK